MGICQGRFLFSRTIGTIHWFPILAFFANCSVGLASSTFYPLAPSFNFQGRLLNEAGTAPLSGLISLTLGIFSGGGDCLLYEEFHGAIDLTASLGAFSVEVGSPTKLKDPILGAKRTPRDPGFDMARVFSNSVISVEDFGESGVANCPVGFIAHPFD